MGSSVMKRRDFIKAGTGGALVAGLTPIAGNASAQAKGLGNRNTDKWHQLGTGKKGLPDRKKTLRFDVAVISCSYCGSFASS